MVAFDGERLMVKYPESVDGKPPPQQKHGWWRFLGRHLPSVSAIVLYPYVVIAVPSGKVSKRTSGSARSMIKYTGDLAFRRV
jgi:hypothetical protein